MTSERSQTLCEITDRIGANFSRTESRERAVRYIHGLLSTGDCVNGAAVARSTGEPNPDGVRRLLRSPTWNADAVRDDLRSYVMERIATTAGVLVIGEIRFPRRLGWEIGVTEGTQSAIFLAYGTSCGFALIDRDLYLPKTWTTDPELREQAGIPDGLDYRSKSELTRRMLVRAHRTDLSTAWVTVTSAASTRVRTWLRCRRIPHLIHLPDSRENLPWPSRKWAEDYKLYDSINTGPHSSYRYWAPHPTTPEELHRAIEAHRIFQECGHQAYQEVGLGCLRTRSHTAWYRHTTLSMAAQNCLVL